MRVFQRYATLDAVSGGRAEVILGRGSSVESFPLFGFDLADYEQLFEEKLALFDQLRKEEPVTWAGATRPTLRRLSVYPRTAHGIPTWVGVGGSPESVIRAARYGMSLMLAIIGGNPARFAPLAALFQQASQQLGQPLRPIGVHSPGHVAETDEQAIAEFWPYFERFLPEARARRGIPAPTEEYFRQEAGPDGSFYVGSPETVARKIIANMTVLGARRFDLKYGVIGLGHPALLRNIQLFGTEVAPRVREALASRPAPAAPAAVW